jgi:hypothetical protein
MNLRHLLALAVFAAVGFLVRHFLAHGLRAFGL